VKFAALVRLATCAAEPCVVLLRLSASRRSLRRKQATVREDPGHDDGRKAPSPAAEASGPVAPWQGPERPEVP